MGQSETFPREKEATAVSGGSAPNSYPPPPKKKKKKKIHTHTHKSTTLSTTIPITMIV